MDRLIVVEGLDGSGKGTQSEILSKALMAAGYSSQKIAFPNYGSPACMPVKMYLAGDFGDKAGDVNAYAASSFYAVDRFAAWNKELKKERGKGKIFIADRYASSNAIHQCAKLPRAEWDSYLEWLEDFEYIKLQIPKPDMVIYLDVDVAVSQKLMLSRYNQDENKKDIHERDVEYLNKCRTAAMYCTEKLGWHRIECCQNGEMLPIENISKLIYKKVMEAL